MFFRIINDYKGFDMFLIIRVIFVLLFGQISFGMSESKVLFSCFTHLDENMQNEVMKYEEHKANLQLVNKYWSEKASVKSPDVFLYNFCNNNKHRLRRILLNAAYCKNHEGVKNILKNSNLLEQKNNAFFDKDCIQYKKSITDGIMLMIKKDIIISLGCIAKYNNDSPLRDILVEYGIDVTEDSVPDYFIPSMMACLTGNSDEIEYINDSEILKKCLIVAIDCDYGSCVQYLLRNILEDYSMTDMINRKNNVQYILSKNVFELALYDKKLKALEALLSCSHFGINNILTHEFNGEQYTYLDAIILMKETNDPQYQKVEELLRKYHTKTLAELYQEKEDQEDARRTTSGCMIS